MWASFKHVYVDTTDSWTENLTLWIWFSSTVTNCKPAVSIDVSPRMSSSPVPVIRCPFAINNYLAMRSSPNKAKYFANANSGYFHWIILLRVYIGWFEQSTAVTCWGFKVFVFLIQSFIKWRCTSSVCTTTFSNGNWNYFWV